MNAAPESTPDTTLVEAPMVVVRDNKIPPKIGGDVLYVLASHDSPTNFGRVRPAKVVELVDDGSIDGLVCLQIFTNGGFDQLPNVHHAKNVVHDEEEHKPGTWHWPPPRTLVFSPQVEVVDTEPPPSEPELPTGVEFASLKEPFSPIHDPTELFPKHPEFGFAKKDDARNDEEEHDT